MQSSPRKDISGRSVCWQILFVGGLTFPMILCELPSSVILCNHFHTAPRNPFFNYGLSAPEVRLYWEGMNALSEHTIVWPLPTDTLQLGNTLYHVEQLKAIAEDVTHTKFPDIFGVEDPHSPTFNENEKTNLIRTHGAGAMYIIPISEDPVFQDNIEKAMAITEEQYGYFKDWIMPQWFVTPTIKAIKLGKLRAIFVGGHLIYVLNIKKGFVAEEATFIHSLTSLG